MTNRELAKNLIDQIPDEMPNIDTLKAFAELENGNGHTFSGTTEQLFSELMEG